MFKIMGRIKYVHVPEHKAYYMAQEDCCFEIVFYDNQILEIVPRIDDRDYYPLNSWDIICRCHPRLEILEVTEEEYLEKRKEVYERKMLRLKKKK